MDNYIAMNKLFVTLLALICITATSCSSDEPKMPTNAITLNMMAGNNRTTLGESDVYINNSNNFTTSYCGIADLGKKGGFNKNPDLSQLAQEVAVTPGTYYQVVLAREILTVGGVRALPVNSTYYNVYVDSWIYNKNNDIEGAKISYAECDPVTKDLPEWDSEIEVTLKPEKKDPNTETASYSFPKRCVIDKYLEITGDKKSHLSECLRCEVKSNSISFTNSGWTPGGRAKVVAMVRNESVYTRVAFNVESSL